MKRVPALDRRHRALRPPPVTKARPLFTRRKGSDVIDLAVIFEQEVATSRTEGVNLVFTGALPFVPHPGMMIAVVDGDDYRCVEEVYYKPGEPLRVYFEFEEHQSVEVMTRSGWKESEP